MLEQSKQPRSRLMRRRDIAAHLREKFGMRLEAQTLAKYAVTGEGPPYHVISKTAVYDVELAELWAERRLSGPLRSSSERNIVAEQTGIDQAAEAA